MSQEELKYLKLIDGICATLKKRRSYFAQKLSEEMNKNDPLGVCAGLSGKYKSSEKEVYNINIAIRKIVAEE